MGGWGLGSTNDYYHTYVAVVGYLDTHICTVKHFMNERFRNIMKVMFYCKIEGLIPFYEDIKPLDVLAYKTVVLRSVMTPQTNLAGRRALDNTTNKQINHPNGPKIKIKYHNWTEIPSEKNFQQSY